MKALVALAVAAALAVVASCSLLDDDIPDRTCTRDDQCFRAQGEVCDLARKLCVAQPDAGPLPDAAVAP